MESVIPEILTVVSPDNCRFSRERELSVISWISESMRGL
jgi:hypothetical protein